MPHLVGTLEFPPVCPAVRYYMECIGERNAALLLSRWRDRDRRGARATIRVEDFSNCLVRELVPLIGTSLTDCHSFAILNHL
jgi:hypothetical protein